MRADLKITLAVVVALVLQAIGALLWAGRAAERLDAVERRLAEQQPVAERLARLEAQMAIAQASLDRIEAHAERR